MNSLYVEENIMLPMMIAKSEPEEMRKRAATYATQFEIAHLLKKYPYELSGGERQRVKLAKELRGKGHIYVLDEPTTGLHASDIRKLMELFESLIRRGNTVIVIEHNTDVMKMADYIIDIGPDGGTHGGEVVFTGTPLEMLSNGHTITAKYLAES